MIPRYSTAEMDAVWSDQVRFGRWLEVELLATEAHAALGIVPAADAATCRDRAPVADRAFVERVLEREAVTDHDVARVRRRYASRDRSTRVGLDPLWAHVVRCGRHGAVLGAA